MSLLAAQMNRHAKFMAKGKSYTAVEGQEVRSDERTTEQDGREVKRRMEDNVGGKSSIEGVGEGGRAGSRGRRDETQSARDQQKLTAAGNIIMAQGTAAIKTCSILIKTQTLFPFAKITGMLSSSYLTAYIPLYCLYHLERNLYINTDSLILFKETQLVWMVWIITCAR